MGLFDIKLSMLAIGNILQADEKTLLHLHVTPNPLIFRQEQVHHAALLHNIQWALWNGTLEIKSPMKRNVFQDFT